MENAYHALFNGALIFLAVLIGIMLIRSVIGPRITDRIMSINMIGTMVISSIAILSQLLAEDYLADVALIYALISFVSVLIFATVYIPQKPGRDIHYVHIEYTREEPSATARKGKASASFFRKQDKRQTADRPEKETESVSGFEDAEMTELLSDNRESDDRTS